MPNGSGKLFYDLIEWIWAPIVGVYAWLYVNLTNRMQSMEQDNRESHQEGDKRISLLEHSLLSLNEKMSDFDSRRREDRKEIMARIDKHSETLYKKIDDINNRLAELTDRISG